MRKHLTAKLFKRLSRVALVLSLVGWGVSEFGDARATASIVAGRIYDGKIVIAYGNFDIWRGDPFDCRWHSLKLRQPHFPLPDSGFGSLKPNLSVSFHYLLIPFWLASLIALTAFLYFRRLERRSAIAPGCCVHCGYDASKCTDNRCSECGEPLAVEAAAAG